MTSKPLPPLSTIGILGSGQLGRMLATAAAEMGFRTQIYCPEENAPAFQVANDVTVAAYDDADALEAFANTIDVATYEFENVPEAAVRQIANSVPVRPDADALAVAQDRLSEKRFMARIGVATAKYAAVESASDLTAAVNETGLPGILKTRRMGYDGKGQTTVTKDSDHKELFSALREMPSILEERISFERELSIIIARGMNGDIAAYDPAENDHRDHILWHSHVPGSIPAGQASEARDIAERIVEALDYVGVMGVEFFAKPDGHLLVNEIAPRVHNSGHWTQDAADTSQFEQHIRAVVGWPLAAPTRHSNVAMENLIGDDVFSWDVIASEPGAHLHLYGKRDARAGRKMGHVNRISKKTG